MATENGRKIDPKTVLDYAVKIVVPLLMFVVGWLVNTIAGHDTRINANRVAVAQIQANRYTSLDAMRDHQRQSEHLAAIRNQIAGLLARLPKKFPPDRTQSTIDQILERLRELEKGK